MSTANIFKYAFGVIGFPLTIWNLAMDRKNRVKPPGQMIKTNFSDVHAIVSGDGQITVILEAGYSSISIDWCYVQPEISKVAKVVSFDRGNYGWSRTTRKSMTSLDSVEEIREVLAQLKIEPPFILVGHSYGGLSMRLFASMYPNEVAGLVLEDSAHENQYVKSSENAKRINQFRRLVTFGYVTSLAGLPRLLKQRIGREFLAKEYDLSLNFTGFTQGAFHSAYREYLDSAISAKQLQDSKPLPEDLPVIVLSANNQTEQWKKHQQHLTRLTNNTEQICVDTGHSIHLEKPEIVTESILKLIEYTNGAYREAANRHA
jgi:pimeloyl-ACP methyl ester carboxylesterase